MSGHLFCCCMCIHAVCSSLAVPSCFCIVIFCIYILKWSLCIECLDTFVVNRLHLQSSSIVCTAKNFSTNFMSCSVTGSLAPWPISIKRDLSFKRLRKSHLLFAPCSKKAQVLDIFLLVVGVRLMWFFLVVGVGRAQNKYEFLDRIFIVLFRILFTLRDIYRIARREGGTWQKRIWPSKRIESVEQSEPTPLTAPLKLQLLKCNTFVCSLLLCCLH